MRLKIWARDAGLDEDEREDGSVGGVRSGRQVEAVGEQGLHHEAHLVDRRIGGSARRDVEELRRGVEGAGDPEGRAGLGPGEVVEAERQFLRAGELVGEGDVAPER